MNDDVIRISPYVRQSSSQPVHPRVTRSPLEAWTESAADAGWKSQTQTRSPSPRREPSSYSSTTPADDRQKKGAASTLERSFVGHSLERSCRYSPPTIITCAKSPPHYVHTGSTASSGETTGNRRLHEEAAGGNPGFEDLAARSTDDVKRRQDVSPVSEQRHATTKVVAEPVQHPHRFHTTTVVREDRETKVDVPKSAGKAPLESDDSDTALPRKQAQETVPLASVPEEKLELLEKLVGGGHVTLGDFKVTVEVREKRLRVCGNAQQIQTATTKALETLARFCTDRAGVNRKQLELLVSDRGQRWLVDLLAQNGGPIVVLFSRNAVDYIVATDRDVVTKVKCVMKRSLGSETIPFGAELSKFLQSKQWADAVEKYESNWFIRVTRDDSCRQIVLDGCVRAVENVVVDVRQLLKQNFIVNRRIQLKTGEYRLIRHHLETEVSQCLQNQQGFVLQTIFIVTYLLPTPTAVA